MKSFNSQFVKRGISCVVALSLIFSFSIMNFVSLALDAKEGAPVPWDGTIADKYDNQDEEGAGGEKKPYEIATAEQLAKLVNEKAKDTIGKYYKLTADIVLNEDLTNNPISWYGFTADQGTDYNGEERHTFCGNFDGDSHTVSGLYFNAACNNWWSGSGLFPRIHEGAKIYNVGVINSELTTTNGGSVGAIAGFCTTGKSYANDVLKEPLIEQCYADDTVKISGQNGGGGIIGVATGQMTIRNCYFTGTANKGAATGGHWTELLYVENFYTNGNLLSGDYIYTNAYTTKSDSAAGIKDADINTIMTAFGNGRLWKIQDGKPVLRTFDKAEQQERREAGLWDGTIAAEYAGGSGDNADDPILIATAEQLAKLVNDTDTADKYYMLTADIKLNADLTDNPMTWYSVAVQTGDDAILGTVFKGSFDGGGHTVSGLYINTKATQNSYWFGAGLFPRVDGPASIRNVGVINSSITITSGGAAGAIAGVFNNSTVANSLSISNCYADETVAITADNVGGIAGALNGETTVEDCFFMGTLTGTSNGVYSIGWNNSVHVRRYLTTSKVTKNGNEYLTNVYSTEQSSCTECQKATLADITGAKAAETLQGFDFVGIWQTVDGKTPMLRKPVVREKGLWSGKEAADYAGGSGTPGDPYQIATGEQLAKLIKATDTAGKYYKLTADIKLNSTTAEAWYEQPGNLEWYSVNDDTAAMFQGNFDGDGHTVSGLYYNKTPGTDGWRSGLFPMIGSGAVIRNVGVINAYMSGSANVGGIVGWSNNHGTTEANAVSPIISGCYADDSVQIKGMRVGGIVGAGSLPVSVDNCYFTGSLTATEKDADVLILAGIASFFWVPGNSIVNCYTIDYPIYREGKTANFSLRDCYSNVEQDNVKLRTKAQMTGAAAKQNMSLLNWDTIWRVTDGTPGLNKVPVDYQANGYDGKAGEIWTGQIATNYAGGNGTKNDPYQIATGEQLAKLVHGYLNAGKADTPDVYYKLTADIKLNDTTNPNWKEEARPWFFSTWYQYEVSTGFRGNFDGNGHVVSGLYLNVENDGQVIAGLIPLIGEGGVVENVGVINSYLRGYDHVHSLSWVGAVVGYCFDWEMPADNDGTGHMATIRGCFADSTVTVDGQMAGGMLGATPRAILIEDCYFTGKLVSENPDRKGGMIGYNYSGVIVSPLRNCYVATAEKDPAIGHCFDTTKCENVYCTVATKSGGSILSLKGMRGQNALAYMKGFDFENTWYACADGTPVLRKFGTTSKYSNTSPFDKVKITFVTNGGNDIEPIYGEEGDKIAWPTVTRYGYEFDGWHVYPELDFEYPLDVFPMNDVTLYAKWNSISIFQGFEDYDDETMLGEDFEYYKLGLEDFSFDYVHEGNKSIHRIGNTGDDSTMVLFDKANGVLTPGMEYDLTMWVYVESANAPINLSLLQINQPRLTARSASTVALPTLNADKNGQWQQISYRFVANAKYLALTVPGNSSIYIDDLMIVPTGNGTGGSGTVGGNNSNNVPTGVNAPTGIMLLGLVSMLAVVAIDKKRKHICQNNVAAK